MKVVHRILRSFYQIEPQVLESEAHSRYLSFCKLCAYSDYSDGIHQDSHSFYFSLYLLLLYEQSVGRESCDSRA